ncbi:MAG: hypothetical protein ACREIT_03405 [Tepidisphaeraceae bacterium]
MTDLARPAPADRPAPTHAAPARAAPAHGVGYCCWPWSFVPISPRCAAGSIGDDVLYVTEEPLIRSPDGLWKFWVSTAPGDYFANGLRNLDEAMRKRGESQRP